LYVRREEGRQARTGASISFTFSLFIFSFVGRRAGRQGSVPPGCDSLFLIFILFFREEGRQTRIGAS